MTPQEQKVIEAARAIAKAGAPSVAGILAGRGFRLESKLVFDLVQAVAELDRQQPSATEGQTEGGAS